MIQFKYLTYFVFFSFAVLLTSSGFAQVSQRTLPVNHAGVINFQQLAEREAVNPPKLHGHRNMEADEDEHIGVPANRALPVDAVRTEIELPSSSYRSPMSPTASLVFNGMLDNGTLIPPDVNGVVGTNHVMEAINTGYRIFNKTGGTISSLSLSTFWSGISSSGSPYCDPHIEFDANYGRWVTCIIANLSNGHYGLFVAVSQTSDPTGSWYEYSIDTGSSTTLPDYPTMGYNVNWVVVTVNNFANGSSFSGVGIYIMSRANLYSGTLGSVTSATDPSSNGSFTVVPAQTMDNTTTTLYLLQEWNGASGSVRFSTITGSVSSPVYTLGTTVTTSNLWSENTVNAPQLGISNKISTNDTRMHSVILRNGSIWATHTVYLPSSSPTRSSIQWWQINPSTYSVQQTGRVDDASGVNFYAFPSMAVDASNNVMIGYATFSSSIYASAGFSYRASTDPVNTMQTPTVYKNGQATYYKTFGGSSNRWGDYTMTSLDPSDGSFWTVQEFAYTPSNTWGTVWAKLSMTAPCSAPSGMTTSNIANNSATFSWNAVSGALSYNLQYRAVGSSTWTTVTGASNPYNVSGLIAGTTYEWQVQTVCSSGSSAFTSSTTFTTTGTAPCDTPTGEATNSITSSSATLSWTAVAGAISYNVQYRVVGAPSWTSASTSSTSYNVTSLSASTDYEWQVATVCSSSSSAFSASTNFTTSAPVCNVPSGLSASGITASSATLSWSNTGAVTYNLQWKLSTSGTWTTVGGIATNSYNLSGLSSCLTYNYQVQSVCATNSSAYSSASSFTTTGCPVNYCTSNGTSTSREYINKVVLNTISNTSGNNNGYGNYTALSTSLAGSTAYTITLTPGYPGSSYREAWNVWIDYNHNGSFADAGEKVATGSATGTLTRTFTVPASALNGSTRMRIQMKYNSATSSSCGSYNRGEVEDYTVTITGNSQTVLINPDAVATTSAPVHDMLLFPNPAHELLNISFSSENTATALMNIYNLMGQAVLTENHAVEEGANNISINTSALSNGVYIFEMAKDGVVTRQRFVISK